MGLLGLFGGRLFRPAPPVVGVTAQPTISLCDRLVVELAAGWGPTAPDAVSRVYEAAIPAESLTGRKVYVFPVGYGGDPASRGEDWYMHRIAVLTVERYDEAGRPPVAWVDTRADFVHEQVFGVLDFTRGGPLRFDGRTVYTESCSEVPVYDAGMLVTKKVFWSEIEFVFREAL